jgi:drug/metabolite transporter (DMT)-like permease
MRMGIALPVFLWLGWRAPRPAGADPLSLRDWASLAALGVAGYYAASILDFVGLQYITAGLERLILFAYPTFTVLIGVFVFRRSWHRREVVCLVLSYAGIALAVAHDFKVSREGGEVVLGGLAVLASALCYAGYLAGSADLITRMGTLRFAAVAMGVSTLATLCHFSLTRPLATLVQPWPVVLIALSMALFSTVLPVLALAGAIRRVGSNRAAMVGTIGPVLTIGLGWLILGEAISVWQLAGAALVITGVRVAARGGFR